MLVSFEPHNRVGTLKDASTHLLFISLSAEHCVPRPGGRIAFVLTTSFRFRFERKRHRERKGTSEFGHCCSKKEEVRGGCRFEVRRRKKERSDSGSRGEMGGYSRIRVIVVRSKEVCWCGQAVERGVWVMEVDVEREEIKQRVAARSVSNVLSNNHAGLATSKCRSLPPFFLPRGRHGSFSLITFSSSRPPNTLPLSLSCLIM